MTFEPGTSSSGVPEKAIRKKPTPLSYALLVYVDNQFLIKS